ncbi:MAG: hypothetical protein FWD31_11080 [Planctomycetaceae bacterium]|nr:hypothetical protein [Planctomycetaceae bacterium]
MENDPDGHVLLLLGDTSPQTEKFKERMRHNIGNTLIKRMIFIPHQPPRRYNQLMAAATMILDSHVYSGGITAYDSMAYGVPSVTRVGPLLVQRYIPIPLTERWALKTHRRQPTSTSMSVPPCV